MSIFKSIPYLSCCGLATLMLNSQAADTTVLNPADEMRKSTDRQNEESHLRSYEMPATIVKEKHILKEEELIGDAKQPRWTAHRRFPSTRIYVIPTGVVDAEYWYRIKSKKNGPTEIESRIEAEIGLPHRFQLDFYLINTHERAKGRATNDKAVELRYALADWNAIPGNPTLYFEWITRDENVDKYEAKLLLGNQLRPGWHWGANLVQEKEVGGSEEEELEGTLAISHTLSDEKLAVGFEGKFAWAHAEPNRGTWEEDLRIGPSLQYRPLKRMHLDAAPLFGITHKSKAADIFLVAGWEF